MADLRCSFAGIASPNPFWLASAPPTDKEYNVVRAFKAGWGGVVWKTLGEDPPIVNVASRYGAVHLDGHRMMGFNNIELITDRPLDVNLREIKEVKRDWPDRAIVVSLMVPCEEESWKHTRVPVLVKLTPNVTNILGPARAAKAGGADGVSLINTVSSITGVDLDRMAPLPTVDGKGTHGGYCGPAVKPIALNMVASIARDVACAGLPISGIGGIATWRDAAEFIALGASNVQVCTAVMHYGFKIVDDLIDGLSNWMDDKGYARPSEFAGKAVANFIDWQHLNVNYKLIARIDQALCIKCGLCHIACEDTSHQAIAALCVDGMRHYEVIDAECVGCNLCQHVCPVHDCITMAEIDTGLPPVDWNHDKRNPHRVAAG